MNSHFSILGNTVHLWYLHMPDCQATAFEQLLDSTELERAARFRFAKHRERYIIGRGILRHILGLYTTIPPHQIQIAYGPHGKPYLGSNPLDLHFNVSHSEDMAIYAFTINKEIGVDIQHMEPLFKDALAKRFFHPDEYAQLMQLSDQERITAFYRLWAYKEALIKAVGKGLFVPHDKLVINPEKLSQSILFEQKEYRLEWVESDPHYQSAFAIQTPIDHVITWQWSSEGPQCLRGQR